MVELHLSIPIDGYDRTGEPTQVVAIPCRPWSISRGVHVDHPICHTCLIDASEAFQTACAPSFYVRANPQNFFDVYPTILQV